MTPRPRAARLRPAALLTLALSSTALAACSGGRAHQAGFTFPAIPTPAAAASGAPASASPAPSPTRTGPPRHDVGPPGRFSGEATRGGSPVLAAKIDNTTPARPQAGVRQADVVYVEQVEAGLTRLLAVFNTYLPPRIGPVRSARSDNVDLLAQYGPIALAYSGANAVVNSEVSDSPLVNDGFDAQPSAYVRDGSRDAPHNLYVDPHAVLALKRGAGAKDTGMHFDVRKPPFLAPGRIVTVTYPSASLVFTYVKALRKYTLVEDGIADVDERGQPILVSNVVVQDVQQVQSVLVDVNGNHTPDNITIGTGDVTVYRDGHAVPGTWTRATAADPTRWRTPLGTDISLRPGQTWVMLAGPAVTTSVVR